MYKRQLFTFERMLDKDHPFRKAYPTEFPYFTDMGLDKNIARVEKLDEHTVKFTLNEVDAAFIQNLAMPFPSIQSAEYAAQLLKQGKASDINQKPIGTGPFVFSRYQKDAQIRFKGNKDYWKPDEDVYKRQGQASAALFSRFSRAWLRSVGGVRRGAEPRPRHW